MSPHDIKVLFHHDHIKDPWPYGETSAYKASRAWLHTHGLIDRCDAMAITTERGKALVALICATPLPMPAFVDPRTGKVVDLSP